MTCVRVRAALLSQVLNPGILYIGNPHGDHTQRLIIKLVDGEKNGVSHKFFCVRKLGFRARVALTTQITCVIFNFYTLIGAGVVAAQSTDTGLQS